jgi:toxin ParE1/3/4
VARVRLSRLADADLTEILAFGEEKFGRATAESYFDSFENAFDLLARHPRLGAQAFPGDSVTRVLHHRRHRIFYEAQEEGVLILRILHHAMDAGRRLK